MMVDAVMCLTIIKIRRESYRAFIQKVGSCGSLSVIPMATIIIQKSFLLTVKKAVYVVHAAISLPQGLSGRTYSLSPYDVQLIDEVEVHMYGSTDEGGSFYVDTGRKQFFHAGDLNWWYWLEDIEANKRQATIDARRELDKLTHMAVDVAFFPVDARLETAREWGALSFLRRVKVRRAFVPIHSNGLLWQPSVYFKALYKDVPLWIPKMDGEMVTV